MNVNKILKTLVLIGLFSYTINIVIAEEYYCKYLNPDGKRKEFFYNSSAEDYCAQSKDFEIMYKMCLDDYKQEMESLKDKLKISECSLMAQETFENENSSCTAWYTISDKILRDNSCKGTNTTDLSKQLHKKYMNEEEYTQKKVLTNLKTCTPYKTESYSDYAIGGGKTTVYEIKKSPNGQCTLVQYLKEEQDEKVSCTVSEQQRNDINGDTSFMSLILNLYKNNACTTRQN